MSAALDERPGTGCHYAEVDGEIACTVHCCFFPCPKAGRPASPIAVHMGSEDFTRDDLIGTWRETTAGQRPLVLHRGSIAGAEQQHHLTETGTCWCAPERVDPDPVIV